MPAHIYISQSLNLLRSEASTKKNTTFPLYQFNPVINRIMVSLDQKAKYIPDTLNPRIEVEEDKNNPIYATDIENLARDMDRLVLYRAGYPDIKENAHWQKYYQAGERSIPYVKGSRETSRKRMTMPCHRCGIVLPIRLITLDHHEPQKKGKDRAGVKVLRAFGCTVGVPTGEKCGVFRNSYRGDHLQDIVDDEIYEQMGMAETKRGVVKSETTTMDKFTLNTLGMVFVGLIQRGNPFYLKLFLEDCLDSWINLSPLCSTCNLSKGEHIKPIVNN